LHSAIFQHMLNLIMHKISKNEKGFSAVEGLLIIVILIVLAGAGYFVYKHHHKTSASTPSASSVSYLNVVKDFITAMDNGDAQTVASLQSTAFSASNKSQTRQANFYNACQSEGTLCTYYFSKTYPWSSAAITTKNYTAKDGAVGKEVDYTISASSSSTSGSNTTSSSSSTVITFDLVPSGNTWQIDAFNMNIAGSAS
jgi:uncharacterized protein (UPF0333 family)